MDKLVGVFSEHGLIGLVVGALFAALWLVVREHSHERKMWLDAYKENTEVIRVLTSKID